MAAVMSGVEALVIIMVTVGCFMGYMHISSSSAPSTGGYSSSLLVNEQINAKFKEFPDAVGSMERRLLYLESTIRHLRLSLAQATHEAPAEVAEGDAAAAVSPSLLVPGTVFRLDRRCGMPILGGGTVECDPLGDYPCCSAEGFCEETFESCTCKGCVDFTEKLSSFATIPTGNKTVAVIIPFRDRDPHLEKFKEYWRWFARSGNSPRKIARWTVYVVEQFDSMIFNRGWTFNVGLSTALGQKSSSPDITPEMQEASIACAAIQDIDYLPERKVDYTDCKVPTQLSSEIDRYKGHTPYLKNTGGVVAMSPKHWKAINGFGNYYFGWGAEDDELYHRMRLTDLLTGNCFPFCEAEDQNINFFKLTIHRPRRGFGRFTGKVMHSMNHTKRVTNSEAYNRNVLMLEEIKADGERWKTDGLNNMEYRIIHHEVDRRDEDVGVVYQHLKVHRGKAAFDLSRLPLVVPLSVCGAAGWRSLISSSGMSVATLGSPIPWNLTSLRSLTRQVVEKAGGTCSSEQTKSINFFLVDRGLAMAKILSDDDPRLLYVYYRSLQTPPTDGLIIADSRGPAELRRLMAGAGASVSPSTPYSICGAPQGYGGMKYAVHLGSECYGLGWHFVGNFFAFPSPRPGHIPISVCDNTFHWTELMVQSETCPRTWGNLKWKHTLSFWAAPGKQLCVGSRIRDEDITFSRAQFREDCTSVREAFTHDFNFAGVNETYNLNAVVVCVGKNKEGKIRIGNRTSVCDEDGFEQVTFFIARTPQAARREDRLFCVKGSPVNSKLFEGKTHCGSTHIFGFAVPSGSRQSLASSSEDFGRRALMCFPSTGNIVLGDTKKCGNGQGIALEAPSVADIAASIPPHGPGATDASVAKPLFTYVEEEVPCFHFLCNATIALLEGMA